MNDIKILGELAQFVYSIKFQNRALLIVTSCSFLNLERSHKARLNMINSSLLKYRMKPLNLSFFKTVTTVHVVLSFQTRHVWKMANALNGFQNIFVKQLLLMTIPFLLTRDNRWIIPYDPYMTQKFNSNINVEICSMLKSVKYIYTSYPPFDSLTCGRLHKIASIIYHLFQ